MLNACVVTERCYTRNDCASGVCDTRSGRCVDVTLVDGGGDAGGKISCPTDMVNVGHRFCMDRYEASRTDATATDSGTKGGAAVSKAGVMPWNPVNLVTARAACKAAGKSLCSLSRWVSACRGPKNQVYTYGNTYDPAICNGIDTYCDCKGTACSSITPCPFFLCYGQCGANFRLMPTGSFSGCVSAHGAFDVNGNVWELTDSNDGLEHFRGGAFNCSDSKALHRCDHDGSWGPSARGFRCCADGTPLLDGGSTGESS